MRKNITLAFVAVVGIWLASGCASTPRRDLSKLQGTWVGEELGGGKGECRITISGDSMRFQGARPQEWYVGKLTLIPNTNPRQATVLIAECGIQKYVNQTAKVIYKIKGKTLTIAGNEPGNEVVPTAFERNAASQTRAFVVTRQ
jgi:uncharacterized protein (TIGR03067 family)